jgi:hypothetical protein
MMKHDENIQSSNLQVSHDGAQITVTVEVLAEAALGTRRIGLETDRGDIMAGPMFDNWFTVTE